VRLNRRLAVLLLLAVGVLLVLTGAWVSSRDNTQVVRESGSELGAPRLTPTLSESVSASVSASPKPSKSSPTAESATPGIPQRLAIPSIGVKAPIDQVGVLPDNTQEVPDSMDRVGWYHEGSMPGQPGNAVITGHTWSKGDGVFDRLPQLRESALITLTTEQGNITYRVSSVGSVALADFGKYASDIYRTTGPSGLVLMTCGDWNGSTYEATTVVYAEPVS